MVKQNDDVKTLQAAVTHIQAQVNRIAAAPHGEAKQNATDTLVSKSLPFTPPGKELQERIDIATIASATSAAATTAATLSLAPQHQPHTTTHWWQHLWSRTWSNSVCHTWFPLQGAHSTSSIGSFT